MINSGIEWIGEIPDSWKLVRLKDIYINKKEVVGSKSCEYERLALTLNGVVKRSKNDSDGLQPKEFDGYQLINKNDFIFKMIDLQNISTSRVGLSQYDGLVSPAYIRFSPRKKEQYNDFVYADKLIMAQYLTKDKSWSTEEEWRVILSNSEEAKGYSQPIDMISAIYIDYSVLKKRRTRRIIQLAKENGWSIYVRYYSQLEAEYRYDTLERTQELIKKIGQN